MHFGEEPGTQILISLLMPFGAYLTAEHAGCSGILAVVAAGITMSYTEITGQALATTRVNSNAVWNTVSFAANGMIFVLLGEQLPKIFSGAIETVRQAGHQEPWWLLLYVLGINLSLICLRFLWVWTSVRFTLFRKAGREPRAEAPSWRLLSAMSVAGVRGTVTLAGILTLPLLLADGKSLPARDLAIFLAAGAIVVSLVVASVGLPVLLKGLEFPPEPSYEAEEDRARVASAEAAIRGVEKAQHEMSEGRDDVDLYADTATRIMDFYRRRIDGRSPTSESGKIDRKAEEIEHKLLIAGLKAARNEIFRLSRARKLNGATMRKLVRELDLLESRYDG